MMKRCMAVCGMLLLALTVGCGDDVGGPQLTLAKATGTVTLDGQALPDVVVMLYPNAGGLPASGTTDAQGHFELTTKLPGDGAVVGTHLGIVKEKGAEQSMDIESGDAYAVPDPDAKEGRIPARFTRANDSGLILEVKGDGENVLKIELTSK